MSPHTNIAHDVRSWAAYAIGRWRAPDDDATLAPTAPLDDAIERVLRIHGLAPLVYRALSADRDARATTFAPDYRHAATGNLLRLTDGERVQQAFARAGIRGVLLKGSAFLARFAPHDLGLRPMADLDVLVDPAQFRSAARQLAVLGYRPAPPSALRDSGVSHAATFVRTGGPLDLEIDLHRAVAPWPQFPRLTSALLAAAEPRGVWRVPSPAHALAHTAIHRVNHGLAWSAVDLLDVHCLADTTDAADRERLTQTVADLGALAAVTASLAQAIDVFGDAAGRVAPVLESCVTRLGARKWQAVTTLLATHDPLTAVPERQRAGRRSLVIWPTLTDSVSRALASSLVYLPLRAWDSWRSRPLTPVASPSSSERA